MRCYSIADYVGFKVISSSCFDFSTQSTIGTCNPRYESLKCGIESQPIEIIFTRMVLLIVSFHPGLG